MTHQVHYKVNLKYIEYDGKMYLNYFSCDVPKSLANLAFLSKNKAEYYYTKQEILFTEIVTDKKVIDANLQKEWYDNLFSPRPYNKEFWKNYTILLESKEQQKLIQDLEKK